MKITKREDNSYFIEHDGLMVVGDDLEEAVIQYGVGMFLRGEQGLPLPKEEKGENNE